MLMFPISLDLSLTVLILLMNGSKIKSVKRVWKAVSLQFIVSEIRAHPTLFIQNRFVKLYFCQVGTFSYYSWCLRRKNYIRSGLMAILFLKKSVRHT